MLRFLLLNSTFLAGLTAGASDVPDYTVVFDGDTGRAQVRLCLAHAHGHVEFLADSPGATGFVDAVRRSGSGKLYIKQLAWVAENWHAGECIEYTADIGAVAAEHFSSGGKVGRNILTDPQVWLLRSSTQDDAGANMRIELPEGWAISTPWLTAREGGQDFNYWIPNTPAVWSSTVALGHLRSNPSSFRAVHCACHYCSIARNSSVQN